jgi:hypothetical protein
MCYTCGFETTDKGDFVSWQSDGSRGWLEFVCPQCHSRSPRVAMKDPARWDLKPPFGPPAWELITSNQGLCVRVETSSSRLIVPVHEKHPVLDERYDGDDPAWQGATLRDMSYALEVRGRNASENFALWCEEGISEEDKDALRKQLRLGSHEEKVVVRSYP